MKRNIFYIDANIYLGFYNSNKPEFKKLLSSIIELSDKIYFTTQFGYEIDRNKLNVFRHSINNYIQQATLSSLLLPEHLDDQNLPKLAAWNKSRKELEKKIQTSKKDLTKILNEVLNDVSLSKDKISLDLKVLYQNAKSPSFLDIDKARLRKEIGNPPGKKDDTLGDQLSWQMLLNVIPDTDQLWIVSNDKDYYITHGDKLYLNPILHNDLIQINSKIKVKVYNKLSEALRAFNDDTKLNSIPSKADLDKISVSEADTKSSFNSFFSKFFNSFVCTNCGEYNLITEAQVLTDVSTIFKCKNCGYQNESNIVSGGIGVFV